MTLAHILPVCQVHLLIDKPKRQTQAEIAWWPGDKLTSERGCAQLCTPILNMSNRKVFQASCSHPALTSRASGSRFAKDRARRGLVAVRLAHFQLEESDVRPIKTAARRAGSCSSGEEPCSLPGKEHHPCRAGNIRVDRQRPSNSTVEPPSHPCPHARLHPVQASLNPQRQTVAFAKLTASAHPCLAVRTKRRELFIRVKPFRTRTAMYLCLYCHRCWEAQYLGRHGAGFSFLCCNNPRMRHADVGGNGHFVLYKYSTN